MDTNANNTDWSWARVKAALEENGYTLRSVAREERVHDQHSREPKRGPNPRMQRAIAERIGLPPQEIWPTRYDPKGDPVCRSEWMLAQPLTISQVKSRLKKAGISHADVARELGASPAIVAGVLAGRFKGRSGEAHKVAVALGLKSGVIVPDGMPIADVIKFANKRDASPVRPPSQKSAKARAASPAPVKESAR